MNHTIIPNTNYVLRAVLVLHGDARPEVQTFPVIAWRVDAKTGTNIPVLAGGLQIAEGESLENWAITEQGSETVYPIDPGALPTTFEAFVARNAPDTETPDRAKGTLLLTPTNPAYAVWQTAK
jgi:hypothetical protein